MGIGTFHARARRPAALLALLCCGVSATASGQTGVLEVNVSGMTSDEGSVVYAVWSGPEHWLEDHAVREGSVPVHDGVGAITLEDLPYGEYAVSVYHDENGNRKLDTGLFSIPKEPIGTSNDAKARFGPPKYDDAAFQLDEPKLTISIPVRKLF